MEDKDFTPGLTERLMREIIETPALKEVLLLQMKDIKAETAPGVVKTLLWADPGISMSIFGAAPDAVNWLLELLLELGRQLNGLPEPLLKDILSRIGSGVDQDKLEQFPRVYGELARRLLFSGEAGPEEVRASLIGALNAALAAADRASARLEEDQVEMSASLASLLKELDVDALRRVLRRSARLAVATARASGGRPGKGGAGKAVGGLLAALAAAACALLALGVLVRRIAAARADRGSG